MRRLTRKLIGPEIGELLDPFRRRWVVFESGSEEAVGHWLAALPSTVDLREQQLARFPRGAGSGHHWLDYVTKRPDGWRVAYAVKAAHKDEAELEAALKAIAAHGGDDIADEFRILRADELDEVTVANARLVCQFARAFDFGAIGFVEGTLPAEGTQTTFREITQRSGLGTRGYRAAVTLVQSGLVRLARGVAITPDAPVTIGVRRNSATAARAVGAWRAPVVGMSRNASRDGGQA